MELAMCKLSVTLLAAVMAFQAVLAEEKVATPKAAAPRDLPLGNVGWISQGDKKPPSRPPIAGDENTAGWIDADFGLQYRLRMPDAKIVGVVVGEGRLTVSPQELPLLYRSEER